MKFWNSPPPPQKNVDHSDHMESSEAMKNNNN